MELKERLTSALILAIPKSGEHVGKFFEILGFTEVILIDSCNQYQIFLKHIKCMINKNRFNTLYDLLDPYENTSSNYFSVCDPEIFTGILQKLCSP